MNALKRWNRLKDLEAFQHGLNSLLGRSSAHWPEGQEEQIAVPEWAPLVDISEDGKEYLIKAELPDMKKDDIEITVENNTLTLRGEKKMDSAIKEECCHRIERTYGAFSRSFSLPTTVDTTKVSADYKNGVLTIKLPVREEAKPKKAG